jgi:antirestriction protein ArdC
MEAELENSAAYLQGWIDALKSGNAAKGWIIRAASQAQKAADFIIKADKSSLTALGDKR